MDGESIYKVLEAVACKEGITIDEVVFEIQSAISVAYQNAKRSNSGALIQLWDEISRKGDIPSVVEMIDYLSMRVLETKTCFELNNDQVKDDRKGRPYTESSN